MSGGEVTEQIIKNDFGQEIHILNGPYGEMRLKKINPEKNLITGEQWCPECHIKMEHKEDYYICPECRFSITDQEAENGEGWPTEEASYDADFGWSEFGAGSADVYDDIYE